MSYAVPELRPDEAVYFVTRVQTEAIQFKKTKIKINEDWKTTFETINDIKSSSKFKNKTGDDNVIV